MRGFNDLPKGAKNSLPILNPVEAMDAAKEFGQAASQLGLVTRQTFDDSESGTYNAKFDAEEIAKVGGGVRTVRARFVQFMVAVSVA